MTSNRAGDQISQDANLVSNSVQAAGAIGGHDRLDEAPIDKAEHLLHLAGLAASLGDFKLAIRLYADAAEWAGFALRDGQPRAHGNDAEGR